MRNTTLGMIAFFVGVALAGVAAFSLVASLATFTAEGPKINPTGWFVASFLAFIFARVDSIAVACCKSATRENASDAEVIE